MQNIEMTIIMPSYNRGEYIEEAINSVLMQKVSFNYKLIIADDSSEDNTLKIANIYKDRYPNKIEVMTSEHNQGLLPNCIRVYENMKTEYFCVLDPDDYWTDDNFIQKAFDFLEANPEYTIYGCNTKILRDGTLLDMLYRTKCEKEMTIKSVDELYNGKMKYITHTTASVFRNVIFFDGVPQIMRDEVGTLSEPAFRGDTGRYMLHLKYGYAKFVDEVVGVYRQHEVGIWTSSSDFHKDIINSRAQIDYCKFYDGFNKQNFYAVSHSFLMGAAASLFKMISVGRMEKIDAEDIDNLGEIIEELKGFQKVEYDYDKQLIELMRNEDHRMIIVWGTGPSSKMLIEKYLKKEKISYFVDSDEKKQGTYINNIQVLSPAQLKDIRDCKYVVIASYYFNEIIGDILHQELCREDEIMNLYKMNCKYSLLFE